MRSLSLIALVLGCGPAVVTPGDESSGGATSEGETSTTIGTSTTSPGSTTVPPPATTANPTTLDDTGTSGESSTSNCGSFLDCHETDELPPHNCSTWDQDDCPEGQKCMPWADDGGKAWNATRCTPLAPDPASAGEPCIVEGSATSGVDNCDMTSMCFHVDPDTNQGICRPFCTGDVGQPFCPGECDVCPIGGDPILAICLPSCDPFEQDCPGDEACYLGYVDSFFCAPDVSADLGAPGDSCEFLNGCDGGSMCLEADSLPACEGDYCCSPFCTVGDDSPCAVLPGTECVTVFEQGTPACSPAGVGVCALPP